MQTNKRYFCFIVTIFLAIFVSYLLILKSIMKHKILLVYILLCTIVSASYATIELRARQMTTSEGLPSNSVRCIYQDSKGFLWLGTLNGLCRYDGNSFITFQPEPDNHKKVSLADNRINKLVEDEKGFLWIGTLPELYSCYDLRRSRFVDYTGKGQLEQNYSNHFFASGGDVWLWHKGNGARRVQVNEDRTMASVEFKTGFGNLTHNDVMFVTEDATGRIWLGARKGLTYVDGDNIRVVDGEHNFSFTFRHEQDIYFLSENGDIYTYRETTDGVVQLSGTVDSQAQSDRAESIAKAVDGVKSVKNDLKTK